MTNIAPENWIDSIKQNINAVHVRANISELGGFDRRSIMLTIGLDPKESWINNIFENSRYARFRIDIDGTVEMFSVSNPDGKGNYSYPKFRKCNCQTVEKLVEKINKFILTF